MYITSSCNCLTSSLDISADILALYTTTRAKGLESSDKSCSTTSRAQCICRNNDDYCAGKLLLQLAGKLCSVLNIQSF